MNKLIMMIGAAAGAVGAMLPLSAMADAVCVYDVDDYAQFGTADLLMQLDGVRNVGATAAHATSPAMWTDLAGGHTVATNGAPVFSGDAWVADKASYFSTSSTAVQEALAKESFTLEMMISNPGDQASNSFEYWTFLGDDMSHRQLVVSLRQQNTIKNPLVQCVQYRESGWQNRSQFSASSITSWNTRQYVAVVCDSTGATTYCDGTNQIHQTAGGTVKVSQSGITIGARFDGESPLYAGSEICAIRMTARALTADELLRNSQVDIARFRNGAAAGVAGTVNVIVASNFAEAEGVEPCGKYVAQSGDAFTAPVTVMAKNVGYVLGGYALETWDDANSAWGAAVTNSGSAAYTYSGSGKVRLTWLWTLTLRAAADYDVGDYVQDDLVAHFDGIRNAGATEAHDPSAATWKNLVVGQPDAEFVNDAGNWNADGYYFKGASKAYARISSPGVTLGEYATIQLALDATPSENSAKYTGLFRSIVEGNSSSPIHDSLTFWSGTTYTTIELKDDVYSGSDNRTSLTGWEGKYVTAMLGHENKYLFQGTTPENHKTRTVITAVPQATYSFGGGGNADNRWFKGTYHSLRIYTNELSEAQLEQNRRVDEIRFRGNGDVTVVNGAIGDTGTNGESSLTDGVYNIETGTWTITAPEIKSGGHTYQPKLLVEIYNATTGEWVATTAKPQWANSYTIDKSALGNGRIRLTWTWQIRKGLIISFF